MMMKKKKKKKKKKMKQIHLNYLKKLNHSTLKQAKTTTKTTTQLNIKTKL